MKNRAFGKHGPNVGAMGFGAMSFGGFYGSTTEAESHATLAACLETGTTHWDTSNVYGPEISENVIGTFFKNNPGSRRHVHLATKGGIKRKPGTTERVFDNSAAYLRDCLEGSLKRMGVDHVDLYYIHRRDPALPIEAIMETLLTLKHEGKIGGIGMSEIAPTTLRAAAKIGHVDAVQSEYSIWTRTPELGLIQACKELGAAFVPFSPLGRGIFTGKVRSIEAFGKSDFRRGNPRFTEPNFSANLRALEALTTFAKARDMTPGQASLAWVLAQGDHLVPIPGTRYAANVRENAGAAAITLTAADLVDLNHLLPPGFAHGDRYTADQWVGPERYS